MSTLISIRVDDEQLKLINAYATLNNKKPSTFIREATLEKIQDEYDLQLLNKTWEETKDDKWYSHDEVKKELGL